VRTPEESVLKWAERSAWAHLNQSAMQPMLKKRMIRGNFSITFGLSRPGTTPQYYSDSG